MMMATNWCFSFPFIIFVSMMICHLQNATAWTTSKHHHHTKYVIKQSSSPRPSHTQLYMISNMFSNDPKLPDLPRDVKTAVSNCRAAVQAALQQRSSRMDITFPVGTKFGVEQATKSNRRDRLNQNVPSVSDFERSDRELARLFVDMFQPVGGANICVVFRDANAANQAKQQWKNDATIQCNILSVDQRKVQAKKRKQAASGKGFAAKIGVELLVKDDDNTSASGPFSLPANTEVALFVAPQQKELVTVERICSQVGMDTLIILLNARISSDQTFASPEAKQLFTQDFDPVFTLVAAPQEVAPGCLLYRAFPNDWVLARKPKVGKPVSIISSPRRLTVEECRAAYESIKVSDVEKGIDNVVDTLAGWLQ
ncbi:hypothetical protein MPSEU_000625400 [Mayamaea pseudoterrestris]|nr:hypothetical protein MPSEU_000625400 [Mayamaea pseudoterrestris]